jgi:hypothetical protein
MDAKKTTRTADARRFTQIGKSTSDVIGGKKNKNSRKDAKAQRGKWDDLSSKALATAGSSAVGVFLRFYSRLFAVLIGVHSRSG